MSHDRETLLEQTKEELVKRAAERNIDGRSNMTKDELVGALLESYKESPPPEPRIG